MALLVIAVLAVLGILCLERAFNRKWTPWYRILCGGIGAACMWQTAVSLL